MNESLNYEQAWDVLRQAGEATIETAAEFYMMSPTGQYDEVAEAALLVVLAQMRHSGGARQEGMMMLTATQAHTILAALETAQMQLPRGPSVWPNEPIQKIADAAFAVVDMFSGDDRNELIDAFTWGLDEID